jgi:hypothetical protein
VKAELLLDSMPSKLPVIPPSPGIPSSIPDSANPMTGERRPGWTVRGEAHPDGIPDLVAIYLASVDNASHINGIRDQETYLAWFDHRLGRFVRELEVPIRTRSRTRYRVRRRPRSRADRAGARKLRRALQQHARGPRGVVRILLGDAEGNELLALAKAISQMNLGLSWPAGVRGDRR